MSLTHILIVDDEGLERQAMKKILTSAFSTIQKVGEAGSGGEAVSYVKKWSPDLVLIDIKMPGMDGLEAIQEIKKINDQIRFIMVSAFNTFEYAQKAIREGVKDYLVKPSKKEEIIQTVARVLQEVETEKAKQIADSEIQANYSRAVNQLQSDWVASLILNHINREAFYLEDFAVEDYQQFVAIVLQLQPNNESKSFPYEEQALLYGELDPLIKSICLAAVGPFMSFQVPILIPFILEKETSIKGQATAIAKQLLNVIEKKYPHMICRIGVGTPVENVNYFSDSYQKALLALEETTENVKFLYYHPSILSKRLDTELDHYEQLLIEGIRSGNLNAFDRLYFDYFKELTAFYEQSLKDMIQHLNELKIVLNRLIREWQTHIFIPDNAFHARSLVQLREQSRSSLLTIVQQINSWQSEKANGIIYKAKEWMDDHFCENVTLDGLAAYVQLSPYYFSKLFKENIGLTFIDYLTQKRIDLSKRLLISTSKTFKEICYEVGYHDPNYFSRVFKKITGMTPSDYRKKA